MLDDCHAFVPNAVEAMQYTRAGTPEEAARRRAGLVPVVVVTCGQDGAIAIDSGTGELVRAPAVPVEALDPTGAGDVFTAGLILGTLRGWPLSRRLAFANLIGALSVQHFGGSLSAPGWGDIADWWRGARITCPSVADRYTFLDEVILRGEQRSVRRAGATIARMSDAHAH
jgi:sugar/nucleoside kinase (ribokinase family)